MPTLQHTTLQCNHLHIEIHSHHRGRNNDKPIITSIMMFLSLEAFLLSLASSTDNFMVGLSVGLTTTTITTNDNKKNQDRQQRHSSSILYGNMIISICNATGAYIAGHVGSSTKMVLPKYWAPLLATIAFGFLAIQEFQTFYAGWKQKQKQQNDEEDEHSNPTHTQFTTSRAIQLALPMTLNNLAGGVAGGAVGVTPMEAGMYGFMTSFITMFSGELIGQLLSTKANRDRTGRIQKQQKNQSASNSNRRLQSLQVLLDPSFVSASLLGFLCLMSLQEVWDAIE